MNFFSYSLKNFYFLILSLALQFMTLFLLDIPKDCLKEPPFNAVQMPAQQ